MKIPTQIEKRIAELLAEAGIGADENVILNHMNLSNAPPDMFLTEAALRRAYYEAEGIEADFYCYMCGEHHETPESFIECMQDHIKDFYAGIPIKKTPEHIEKMLETTPAHMREHISGILKKHVKEPTNNANSEEKKE